MTDGKDHALRWPRAQSPGLPPAIVQERLREAVAINEAWRRVSQALEQDDFAAADALGRQILAQAPNHPVALTRQAVLDYQRGRLEEARQLAARALAQARSYLSLDPSFRQVTALAQWTLAASRLSQGAYDADAWNGFRARHEVASFNNPRPQIPLPEWRGEDVDGGRLFLAAEQGFGDQIQFARFAPQLKARGTSVTLICHPALTRLFGGIGVEVVATTHAHKSRLGPKDRWATLMSIPASIGLTLETLPQDPYLAVARATTPKGARMGLVTAGDPAHPNDRRRSLDPQSAGRLAALPGAISLAQKDTGARDFAETAAIIAGLELVITVDTSVAHLAGAMGKPVWILLPDYGCDWRWMRERADSPWYPSARLYRQATPGDWRPVLDRVMADLDARA